MPNSPQPFHPPALLRSGLCAILLLLTILPGCIVGDFISVYFNTFYNAQRMFKDAEDEVWALPETRMSGKNMLTDFAVSQNSRTKFTQIIEKCSKLLQYHPDSRYVDDALLMIAKSYYYQGDFQRANRKCQELIDGFPQSELVLDARLLLACAQYKGNYKVEAEVTAKAVVAQAKENGLDGTVARGSLVLAGIAADAKNYSEAQDYYKTAGKLGDNADLRANAYLRAAEMNALMKEYSDAQSLYSDAVAASNNYVLEYRGQIGIARMLAARGRYSNALDHLRDLRGNMNNREFFGEISLDIANVYRDMGDIPTAIDQYIRVDTAYARTEAAAKSYYQLGLLYESTLFLYDSARVVYNRGRTEWPAATVTQELVRRADYMNRYFQFRSELKRYDSLRVVAVARNDTLAASSARPDTAAPIAVVQDSVKKSPVRPPAPQVISLDSIDFRRATLMDELATLLYATMGRNDSAVTWYHTLLAEFPDGPFVPRVLYTLAQINTLDSTASPATSDSLYREIIRKYPETDFAAEARRLLGLPPEARRIDPAQISFGHATEMIDRGEGLPAADTLKDLIRQHPNSPLVPKATYTIGWIYENIAVLPDSAFAYYDRVMRMYPGTPYAQRVLPKVLDPQVRTQILTPKPVDTTSAKTPAVAPAALDSTGQIRGRADTTAAKGVTTAPAPPPGQPAAPADTTGNRIPPGSTTPPAPTNQPAKPPGTDEANPAGGHK